MRAGNDKDHGRGAAPREAYGAVRSRIRTGDIFLFQGQNVISKFIRWGSDSVYSHSAIAAWWGSRLVVFQAAEHGVQVLPMSAVVDVYHGEVDWWSLLPQYVDRLDQEKLISAAVTKLGEPFAVGGLLRVVWHMLSGTFRGTPDPRTDPEALFCSQYVSYCYRTAGLDLRPDTQDAFTSPGDLARSGKLALQAVLHK